MNKKVLLKVYGRVQGVFYRDSARRKARKLNLSGWIKNKPDGTVEILAQGEEKALKSFIDWCYNGSILSKVQKIDIKWGKPETHISQRFEIKY